MNQRLYDVMKHSLLTLAIRQTVASGAALILLHWINAVKELKREAWNRLENEPLRCVSLKVKISNVSRSKKEDLKRLLT